MTMRRRHLLGGAAAALATAFPALALAQGEWPQRPVRLVVPFPPGGGTDATSRLVADRLNIAMGWTMVIDNKPGAGGNIGLDAVAKAAPDGYTIGMGQAANLAINPSLYAKMPFDALKDFTPIASVALQPVVLTVRRDSPFKNLQDFIKAAKARPGTYGIAQAGNGTVGHLAGEMLARRAGIEVLQVPYKGANTALTDLMGGQVDLYFGNTVSVMS
ncbi:Bug family tripartite tricarboxylate transporter substrate binding protein, partial [Delftia acidovorans]